MFNYYSQYGEDRAVAEYLGQQTPISNILDIGANDGMLLSNSLHFIERGWGGSLIEAGAKAFDKLQTLHSSNVKVQCLEVCLDVTERKTVFYHNENHMNKGDTDLLSTLNKSSYEESSALFPFNAVEVKTKTFEQISALLLYSEYKVISIDIEGLDYEILKQIDLNKYKCDILIIEYNGDLVKKKNIQDYCETFGEWEILLNNGTNVIFTRQKC